MAAIVVATVATLAVACGQGSEPAGAPATPAPTLAPGGGTVTPPSPSSPISQELTLSPFTPSGTGGEAEVVAVVSSAQDAPSVTVVLEIDEGLELLEGDPSPTVRVQPGAPTTVRWRVRASEAGDWTLVSRARWQVTQDTWFGATDAVCISVAESAVDANEGRCPTFAPPAPGIGETTPARPSGAELPPAQPTSAQGVQSPTPTPPPIASATRAARPAVVVGTAPGASARSPISQQLAIFRFEPAGVGGEADVAATVSSAQDAPSVSISLELGEGLELLDGESSRTVEVRPGEPDVAGWRIRASAEGDWTLESRARWQVSADTWFGATGAVCVSVGKGTTRISEGRCASFAPPPPGPGVTAPSRPSDATSPQAPSPNRLPSPTPSGASQPLPDYP